MELFEALLILFAEAAKDRNKVAHWVWGHGSSLPDAILKAVQKYSDDRFDQLTLRKTETRSPVGWEAPISASMRL